jgi:Na+-translocating ferredoxin:NAD+ oxidoreductase RNF subunit RnfB
MTEYLIAAGVMGGMGLVLALVLAYADRKLYVYEDPRIDEVEALLPKANCGACGCAGCRSFAEQAVNGQIAPGRCTVNSAENIVLIASLLKVDAGAEEKRVARLACAGGSHVARRKVQYTGIDSCRAAVLVAGGGKGCSWGCLGLADCAIACTFDAIHMDAHGLPVVDVDKCTACGDCVDACPKELFSLHPVSHRLWVACRNLLNGDLAEADCEVACTACGRCAMDAPAGLVRIENSLAVVDYSRNHLATRKPIERCPTGAIVWLNAAGASDLGLDAKRIARRSALPVDEIELPVPVGAGRVEGRHS